MPKILACLIVVGCLVAAGFYFLSGDDSAPVVQVCGVGISEALLESEPIDGSDPKDGAIVFEMGYHGLGVGKDDYSYNAFWGYGGGDQDTEFIEAVRETAGKIKTVYNPNFKGAEYSAVEYEEETAKAFYFDLNANGKLEDGEKILPSRKRDRYNEVDFLTPDFLMKTADDKKVPFRALLRAAFYGDSTEPSCMWSPSCLLEGNSKVKGDKMNLRIMTNGFSGSFLEFGKGYFSVKVNGRNNSGNVFRQKLSSLVYYDDVFYDVRFLKSVVHEGGIRVVLEENTFKRGEIALKVAGDKAIKARFNSVDVSGAGDGEIHLTVPGSENIALPMGDYVIDSGYLYYGKDKYDEYNVSFAKGPVVKVGAGGRSEVEIGKPRVQVSAVDERTRYSSEVKEGTVFKKGTRIFLSPKVTGVAGELYGRFIRQENNNRVDLEPGFEILDSGGKQIASGTMEYG